MAKSSSAGSRYKLIMLIHHGHRGDLTEVYVQQQASCSDAVGLGQEQKVWRFYCTGMTLLKTKRGDITAQKWIIEASPNSMQAENPSRRPWTIYIISRSQQTRSALHQESDTQKTASAHNSIKNGQRAHKIAERHRPLIFLIRKDERLSVSVLPSVSRLEGGLDDDAR